MSQQPEIQQPNASRAEQVNSFISRFPTPVQTPVPFKLEEDEEEDIIIWNTSNTPTFIDNNDSYSG